MGPRADFLNIEQAQAIATTPARDDSSFSGATFTIVRVETDARSTLVEWAATHPRTLEAGGAFDATKWQSFPVLATSTQRLPVLTYKAPTG